MSKIRLVAYRKKQSTDTFDATFELDLQEAPNISLNYQFADIREPEKEKPITAKLLSCHLQKQITSFSKLV